MEKSRDGLESCSMVEREMEETKKCTCREERRELEKRKGRYEEGGFGRLEKRRVGKDCRRREKGWRWTTFGEKRETRKV